MTRGIRFLRRLGGVAVMAAGIAFAAWLVFGPVHDWEGDMRLVKMALGLTATGVISGGAWLIFWDPRAEDATEEEAAAADRA
ncbi:hypothetical protein AB0I10_16245 [Streptomyces sp. NPDC050636]|uniref:hypothetical protein n=1 Tax=Streptomyces sp. NPDC050636 TaxID=3154510 RepID=UPI00342F79D3